MNLCNTSCHLYMLVILISPSCPSLSPESNTSHFNCWNLFHLSLSLSPPTFPTRLHLLLSHLSYLLPPITHVLPPPPLSCHSPMFTSHRLTRAILHQVVSWTLEFNILLLSSFRPWFEGKASSPQISQQSFLHFLSGGKELNYFHTLLRSSLFLLFQMNLV